MSVVLNIYRRENASYNNTILCECFKSTRPKGNQKIAERDKKKRCV